MNPRVSSFVGRRLRSDEGAVILEAAMVLPILATFMLGLVELGFLMRQGNAVERAVSAGARVNTQLANLRNADFESIRTVNSLLNSLQRTKLLRIVVFNPDSNGNMSTFCSTDPTVNFTAAQSATDTNPHGSAAANAQCNVYTSAQAQQPNPGVGFPATIGGTTCGSGWDQFYCPLSRNPGTSAVGVMIEVEYTALTKMFGSTTKARRQAYYVTEPVGIGG